MGLQSQTVFVNNTVFVISQNDSRPNRLQLQIASVVKQVQIWGV